MSTNDTSRSPVLEFGSFTVATAEVRKWACSKPMYSAVRWPVISQWAPASGSKYKGCWLVLYPTSPTWTPQYHWYGCELRYCACSGAAAMVSSNAPARRDSGFIGTTSAALSGTAVLEAPKIQCYTIVRKQLKP